jgi:hypothetical protein
VAEDIVGFETLLVKLFGPDQDQVTGIVLVVEAVKFISLPVQTGVLELTTGRAGVSLTITLTVPAAEVHPASVAVTVYVPSAATEALVIDGFESGLEKLLGPLQFQVTLAVVLVALRLMVCPLHIGEVLVVAKGVAGGLGSDRVMGPIGFEGHPFCVTIILEYVPERNPLMV